MAKLADQPKPQLGKFSKRKRENKLKRKFAQKCLLTEFCQMRGYLNHLVKRDNELAAARNDLRNLQGQLFTERVAMSTYKSQNKRSLAAMSTTAAAVQQQ